MGKIIQVSEAARRLGLTSQTIRNWAESGAISIKKVGNAYYVDEDTVTALQDTVEDVVRQREALKAMEKMYHDEWANVWERTEDGRLYRRYTNLCVENGLQSGLFQSVLEMMAAYGSLTEREASVLMDRLQGKTLDEIGIQHELTRERVRQIAEKAIRKSRDIEEIKTCIEHIKELKADYEALKLTVSNLQDKLHRYEEMERKNANQTEEERRQEQIEQEALFKIFSKKVEDCEFTTRTINILRHGLDCETIGDVCKRSRSDFLKARNAGKKSLAEVDDYLEFYNLSWDMDVDMIYQERVERLLLNK